MKKPTIALAKKHAEAPLLRIDAAADRLGIGNRTMRGLISDGKIPVVRIGRAVRIDPSDLARFIEERKTMSRENETG